jgi:DNA-binding LytR/AlgR family response regulator
MLSIFNLGKQLMKHSYIIIDDSAESILKTLSVAARFENLQFLASANSYNEGLDLILEHRPAFIFLEINPADKNSNLSLMLINELYRFLKTLPKIIITSNSTELAIEAIQHGAFDYLSKPIDGNALRKTILKFERMNEGSTNFDITSEQHIQRVTEMPSSKSVNSRQTESVVEKNVIDEMQVLAEIPLEIEIEDDTAFTKDSEDDDVSNNDDKPLIICVKSYGDYRFIEAKDICYLQADNNSTDIHLYNGEMITAFKTLKHFENVLVSPFVRIHNSYIVNIDYVSRIHTGNSVCYIKNTTTKLPFSKSYKENVDAIINSITKGNYLEI